MSAEWIFSSHRRLVLRQLSCLSWDGKTANPRLHERAETTHWNGSSQHPVKTGKRRN